MIIFVSPKIIIFEGFNHKMQDKESVYFAKMHNKYTYNNLIDHVKETPFVRRVYWLFSSGSTNI